MPTRGSEELATARCAAGVAASRGAPAAGAPGWAFGSGSPPGFEIYNMATTYDSADGYLLLFGSVGGVSPPLNGTETWAYSGGVWTQIHPALSPESCPSSALAYDSVDQYVVYFGGGGFGNGNCSSTGQTWTFSGNTWTQIHPATSPSARAGAAFTNDSRDGYLLLFGGLLDSVTNHVPSNQTWEFVSGTWTLLNPALAPSARSSAGMTYDAADGYVLLFGGNGANYAVYNDTWNYSGGTWVQLHPSSHPIAPWPDGLSYDASDRVAVYTSAENLSASCFESEQVWTFAGGIWTDWLAGQGGHTSVAPCERLAEVTGYDWRDAVFVLFGGVNSYYQPVTDTWAFHNGNWTDRTPAAPSARWGAAGAYDAADGYFVLFGGHNASGLLSDTWKWSNGNWTLLATNQSPPARELGGMTYDAADGYLLLFGGAGGAPSANDTWEFTNGGWTKITPAASPPAAESFQDLTYDAADGYVVLLDTGVGGPTTWAYHAGVWTNLTGGGRAAPPYPTNGIVYDSNAGKVVLFGTQYVIGNGAYPTNATWTFLNGNWTNITSQVGPTPGPTWYGSLTYDASDGYILYYGGTSPYGAGSNITWSFAANRWAPRYSPVAPSTRDWATLGYDAASGTDLLFGGAPQSPTTNPNCSSGYCGDTWVWSPGAVSSPVVQRFSALPNPIDLGATTTLNVTAYGGAPPYTYTFSNLPPGCSSANTSSLACTPSSLGSYSITVQVTDSAGKGAEASLGVSVLPDLAIGSFYASPTTVPVGVRTLLSVTPVNGSPPVGYRYSGLPPGCASQTVPTLPCTPGSVGTYDVTVTATDSSGHSATAQLNLTVTAATGSGVSPVIVSYGVAPAAIKLGNSTTFYLNFTGPVGAVSVAYSGLPPGCLSANVTRLACLPTAAGVYPVRFLAIENTGNVTAVEANLTVYPVGGGGAALISAFGASPGVVVVGSATIVSVEASGGTGPLSYSYPSLPPGCHSADTATLPCTPSEVGNFSVVVVVSDSLGNRTGARTTLAVVAGATHPPAPGPGAVFGGVPYVDWFAGAALGMLAALVLTHLAIRRIRLRREGEGLVSALNDVSEVPPRPPAR